MISINILTSSAMSLVLLNKNWPVASNQILIAQRHPDSPGASSLANLQQWGPALSLGHPAGRACPPGRPKLAGRVFYRKSQLESEKHGGGNLESCDVWVNKSGDWGSLILYNLLVEMAPDGDTYRPCLNIMQGNLTWCNISYAKSVTWHGNVEPGPRQREFQNVIYGGFPT